MSFNTASGNALLQHQIKLWWKLKQIVLRFNTASGNALLQLKAHGKRSRAKAAAAGFNTASGNAQLQQCPWKRAPGLG